MKKIVGAWKLISFQVEDTDKKLVNWREKMHGSLIYSPCGHMSVAINGYNHTNSNTGSLDESLFYSGTYKISQTHVIHSVTETTSKSRINQDMIREVSFSPKGDLILKTCNNSKLAILQWSRA